MRWLALVPVVPLVHLLVAGSAAAQDTLSLPALQDAAVMEDPRLRQVALEESATDVRLREISAGALPALRLTGEATRQSEVAAIPIEIPGMTIPVPPKERFEVALSADWLLLDGGLRAARREVEGAELEATRADLAARLYPLRAEVMEAYFGALLLQERGRELATLIEDLNARLAEVRAGARAGAALPGDTAAVRAEMLRAVQQRDEVSADRRASLAVLARLTGREISDSDVLSLPDLDIAMADGAAAAAPGLPDADVPRAHPRYALFEAQRERLAREEALARRRSRPRVSAFGKVAYGRPGLEQFSDDFHDYWRAGLRVDWTPWDRGTTDRELESLRLRREILDTEEAAFSEGLAREIQPPLASIQRLRSALELDGQIIALREQVERQARAQFAERAITASTYVDARTDLQEARLALLRHQAELARAQAHYLTTLGVPLR